MGQTWCRALLGQAQDRARAHADWATPNLAPYPPRSPLTARVECGVVGEIVGGFFIRKDETSSPSPFISRGNTDGLGGRPTSLAAGCCNCPCTSSGY